MLMEIIGRALDINEHLISELADSKIEAPKNYKETFLFLKNLKILPEDFADEISKSAGFRNAIVHEYNNLDQNIVLQNSGRGHRSIHQILRLYFEVFGKTEINSFYFPIITISSSRAISILFSVMAPNSSSGETSLTSFLPC